METAGVPSAFPLCRVGLVWFLSQKVNVVSEADAVLFAPTVLGLEAETSIDLHVTVASSSKHSRPGPFPPDSSLLSPSPASGAHEACASHTDGRKGWVFGHPR